jgi:hypothetical protein
VTLLRQLLLCALSIGVVIAVVLAPMAIEIFRMRRHVERRHAQALAVDPQTFGDEVRRFLIARGEGNVPRDQQPAVLQVLEANDVSIERDYVIVAMVSGFEHCGLVVTREADAQRKPDFPVDRHLGNGVWFYNF